MKKRFEISEIHICTLKVESIGIRAELEKYPRRMCVIDNERKVAVDIKHELEYDYIESMNDSYLINSAIDKIKESKRVAIFPIDTYLSSIKDKTLLIRAKKIIEFLSSGKKYADGNIVLNNEEYLKQVELEENDSKDKSNKTKKIGKKQK